MKVPPHPLLGKRGDWIFMENVDVLEVCLWGERGFDVNPGSLSAKTVCERDEGVEARGGILADCPVYEKTFALNSSRCLPHKWLCPKKVSGTVRIVVLPAAYT